MRETTWGTLQSPPHPENLEKIFDIINIKSRGRKASAFYVVHINI